MHFSLAEWIFISPLDSASLFSPHRTSTQVSATLFLHGCTVLARAHRIHRAYNAAVGRWVSRPERQNLGDHSDTETLFSIPLTHGDMRSPLRVMVNKGRSTHHKRQTLDLTTGCTSDGCRSRVWQQWLSVWQLCGSSKPWELCWLEETINFP